jgi:K+-transporting ATPase KdpF subunit
LRVKYERFTVHFINCGILFVDIRTAALMRVSHGGYKMNVLYMVAGIIALILLVYLVLALLKPEWFK